MLTVAPSTYGSGSNTSLPPMEQPVNNRYAALPGSQANMGSDIIEHRRHQQPSPEETYPDGAAAMYLMTGL